MSKFNLIKFNALAPSELRRGGQIAFVAMVFATLMRATSSLADPAPAQPRWWSCGVYVEQPAPALDVCVDYRDGERSCKVALLRDGKVVNCMNEAPPSPYLLWSPTTAPTTEVVRP